MPTIPHISEQPAAFSPSKPLEQQLRAELGHPTWDPRIHVPALLVISALANELIPLRFSLFIPKWAIIKKKYFTKLIKGWNERSYGKYLAQFLALVTVNTAKGLRAVCADFPGLESGNAADSVILRKLFLIYKMGEILVPTSQSYDDKSITSYNMLRMAPNIIKYWQMFIIFHLKF